MREPSIATNVRHRVVGSRERFWRPEEFEGSPVAVVKALSRLVATGELIRVRRGLYWRGTTTPLGMSPPPIDRLAGEIAPSIGSGPAGLSAALALGLSTQVPRHRAIAISGRIPRSPGSTVLVSRAASTKRRDERLRPEEVAVLEVLRDWDKLVEVPDTEAIKRLGDLMGAGVVRSDRLVRSSATEPARVRDGLRHLFSATGRSDAAGGVKPSRSKATRHELSSV